LCSAILWSCPLLAESASVADRLQAACGSGSDYKTIEAEFGQHHYEVVQGLLARQAASTDAARSELLALRGAMHFLAGDMQNSVLAFDQAAQVAPLRHEDRFTLAMACIRTGNTARAGLVLTELNTIEPTQPLYPYWLGKLNYDQHRYAEAVQQFRRAIDLQPQFVRAWNGLGLTFDMEGEADEANRALGKAAELNRASPTPSPWPPHDFGAFLLRTEHLPEAEAQLREALRYDPNFVQAQYHLGRVLEKENVLQEAIVQYRAAVSGDKSFADACYSLGTLYRKLGDERQASAMFAEYRRRHESAVRQ
jgi:tetratricopeptide (TPR) repeat protein